MRCTMTPQYVMLFRVLLLNCCELLGGIGARLSKCVSIFTAPSACGPLRFRLSVIKSYFYEDQPIPELTLTLYLCTTTSTSKGMQYLCRLFLIVQ